MSGFILNGLNEDRNLEAKWFYSRNNTQEMAMSFLAHKAICIITVPSNVLEMAISAIGFTAAACTLGAFKVMVFALTLGNTQLSFSTGCIFFIEGFIHGAVNLAQSSIELIGHGLYGLYQCGRGIHWIMKELGFGYLGEKLLDITIKVGKFVGNRLVLGLEKTYKNDLASKDNYSIEIPKALEDLDKPFESSRIRGTERTLGTIFEHYFVSIASIPMNAAISLCASAVTTASLSIMFFNIALTASTGINLPIPTCCFHAAKVLSISGMHLAHDILTDAVDVAIIAYKISDAIGVTKVIATVGELLLFIPKAIFS